MAKRTKSKRPRPPRAELVTKWPEFVAAWKAKLREELPEPAHDLLKALLDDVAWALQEDEKSPAVAALHQKKATMLRAFAEKFSFYRKALQDRDTRMEAMGPGGWSPKRPDLRGAWLEGVHDTLLLFDILLFSKTRGGITERALERVLSREAGVSVGTKHHKKVNPPKYSREQPEWQRQAEDMWRREPKLSKCEIARRIDPTLAHIIRRYIKPPTRLTVR